jgi:CheY-like chemotaxis protein
VAHDFNNLLAVILGNTELLEAELGDNPLLTTIDRAATRCAELTQRLLTFSRQQALQPQPIDLTELIPGLHELFRSTLGGPVEISMDVPKGLWPVTADPGQLENALLNLAINARDAMPNGGILEIKCENIELPSSGMHVSDEVAAGDYVQIAVRDTGSGMAAGVLEHAFEPFYTTKDVGQGSGLGLSMVYGFARQSGGDATIENEPGTGTAVRLLLPRSEATTMSDELTQGGNMKRGRKEAILVLEDDPDVRSFAVAALEGLGYRVHEAADVAAAMRVLEAEADKLDLLLSDVVLPGGVSGPELAAKARSLYPKLKLVFMSGYAADLYTGDKVPGFDELILTKPFRLNELSKAIHDTLAE